MEDQNGTSQATSVVKPTPAAARRGGHDDALAFVNSIAKKHTTKEGNDAVDFLNGVLSKQPSTPAPTSQPTPSQDISDAERKEREVKGEHFVSAYNPSWAERVKNVFFKGGIHSIQKAEDDHQQLKTGYGTSTVNALRNLLDEPLLALDELLPKSVKPEGKLKRVVRGGFEAASGLTSGTNVAMIVATDGVSSLERLTGINMKAGITALHAAGHAMTGTAVVGLYENAKQIHSARVAGDSGAEAEAWGSFATNLGMLVLPHATGHVTERIQTAKLNPAAQNVYGKTFAQLTESQKLHVAATLSAETNPKLRSRIDAEVEKIKAKKVSGRGGQTVGEQQEVDRRARHDQITKGARETEIRQQAAKAVVTQLMRQHATNEHYKQTRSQQEASIRAEDVAQATQERAAATEVARKAQDENKKTDEVQSLKDARGFAINDERVSSRGERGTVYTTAREPGQRYDPEPAPAAPDATINDLRRFPNAMPEIRNASEMERPIQEFAEQRMGASFSSLPLDQKRVVARYFERNHPEQWDTFKGTQAYDSYRQLQETTSAAQDALKLYLDRTEGSGEELNPGADEYTGISRLLTSLTDVSARLKEVPDVGRNLNEATEKAFGKSFDSLDDGDKPAALANFLRDNPESVDRLVTPEISERMRNGQHIDLANMEAGLRDQHQVQVLMQHRNQIRAEMDEMFSGQVMRDQREQQVSAIREMVANPANLDAAAKESITGRAAGITELAESINLDGISDSKDLFHVEHAIRLIPDADRTADMRRYLGRIADLRFAAENEVIRQYRAGLAEQLRHKPVTEDTKPTVSRPIRSEFKESARAKRLREASNISDEALGFAAREVAKLEEQKHSALRLAENNSGEYATPQQKVEAQEMREVASFVQRQEDAVVQVVNGVDAVEPVDRQPRKPMILGRASEVVLNSGERVAVRYGVIEADELNPSHDVLNLYKQRENFPTEVQPREYDKEKELQNGVETRSNNIDPDQVHTDTNLPIAGPPIIRDDGVVFGGNGRTMSQILAIAKGKFEHAIVSLRLRAGAYELDQAEIDKMKKPILVRVMDEHVTDPVRLAQYGIDMNRDPSMGQSAMEQASSLSRLMTSDVIDRIAAVAESFPEDMTVRQMMSQRSGKFAQILMDAKLVDPNKAQEFITQDGNKGEKLTEKAKDLLENIIAAQSVSNAEILRTVSPAVKNKLARVGIEFIRMKAAGENYDLAGYNTEAVELYSRTEDLFGTLKMMRGSKETSGKAAGGEYHVERLLHPDRFQSAQEDMFGGSVLHPPVHPVVEALAMALESKPKEYADMVGRYADSALNQQNNMFGAEHPSTVFNNTIGVFVDAAGQELWRIPVLPEEWGAVTALPDSVKEQIEAARGPMAVEPASNDAVAVEDVQPDMTSVTVAERSTAPRNVTEFREALAQHQNITEEQATAISEVFETILPNAIGESFSDILSNRRLSLSMGGEDGVRRGYTDFIDEANTAIHLFEKAEPSTVMHEMFHMLRRYLKPEHQAAFNEFVEAKPGQEWTVTQEEKAAQAFERYHFDGGRKKGALEKAFAVIHRAMQSVYDAVAGRGLVEPSPRIKEMFDRWYDWTRNERKPITKRVDVEALEKAATGKATIPKDAVLLDSTSRVDPSGRVHVFVSRAQAEEFIDRNNQAIRTYGLYEAKDHKTFYVKANAVGKRLYQSQVSSLIDLARQANQLEERLKTTTDPREEARLRATLNSIENRMSASTYVFGSTPAPRNNEVIQLIHGFGERASVHAPTTPAQAMQERQIHGDPTALEIETNGKGKLRTLPDETSRLPEPDRVAEIPERAGDANGRDETAGQPLPGRKRADGGRGASLATPSVDPLAKVHAAELKAPERQRGMPLADAEAWRGYVDALGLPEGTPPPTVRLPDDLREMMIFPGQAEAVEIALSGLQQHDAVVMAAPTGGGKTWMSLAIADQLLGGDSSKVGLVVTRSRNLIKESDGYIDAGQRLGVQVDMIPNDMSKVEGGGVYATTYAQMRGNKELLSVPWDFVIFDEAAELRNWNESSQGKMGVLLGHAAKKVVYTSATPFHTALEVGYMHKLGMWPEGGFFEWARQFGVVEVGPNSYIGGYAPKKLMKLRQQLIERGQWVSLNRDLEGVSAHVALVEQSPELKEGISKVRSAFALAAKIFREQGKSSLVRATQAQEVIYLKRFIEAARLPQVIEAAKKATAEGWQPVIYSEYRSGTEGGMEFFNRLPPGMADHVNAQLPALPDVVKALRAELGHDVAIFAGEANQLRGEERTAFLNGQKKSLYTTYAAGGVGVGFHDKVGDRPRMGLFLGLPWSGIMFEQSLGRTWRYGTKSNVANVFFTSDTLPEMKLMATKILPRMRALNAAVYGEVMETKLSRALRESTGIPEEMLDYEMGSEVGPDAAQFEQTAEGVAYTPASEFEMPKSGEAKNKGMKYKQQPKRLYQGPPDPVGKDARDAFDGLALNELPPSLRFAMTANRSRVMASAVEAAHLAVPGVESPAQAIQRVTRDSLLNAKMVAALFENESVLSATHTAKRDTRATANFVKSWIRIAHTAGDRAIAGYFADHGMAKEGKEVQRKLIERQHLITEHRGDLMDRVMEINGDLTPAEHSVAVRVLEGQTTTSDERIQKAADDYRKFFADVRKQLGEAGAVFKTIGPDGKQGSVAWKDFKDNPTYWPHTWDWNQKIYFEAKDGRPAMVKTLGELHDMQRGTERDNLVAEYAEKRGLNRLQAQEFFSRNRRTIKLAPNLERARETSMPGYDTSLRAMNIYINQVSEMLANIATVGQEREHINPLLYQLPTETMRTVDSIITADLNPSSIGSDNNIVLRRLSQWVVLSKMGMSVVKLGTHVMLKTPLVTNTRSLVGGMLSVVKHPVEMTRMAGEAGILTDYVRQAMMMEYGLHDDKGLDRKMLKYTGFTQSIWLSRIIAGAAGRHFLTVHAEPALRKNPSDSVLRRKLSDLYGYDDEALNRIASGGMNERDVKRAMIAGADWTTGSGRASELPPALRAGDDHPINQNFRMLFRLTYLLKTYAFKTTSLINRTVFDEMRQPEWKQKNFKPLLRLLVDGGAAGTALTLLQMNINSVANPKAAEEQKKRFASVKEHPQALIWLELSALSYAVGLYPAKVFFDWMGTYDQKSKKTFQFKRKMELATATESGGILGGDAENLRRFVIDFGNTFQDDGTKHRDTPAERRTKALNTLLKEEIAPARLAESALHTVHGSGAQPTGDGSGYIPHRRSRHGRSRR